VGSQLHAALGDQHKDNLKALFVVSFLGDAKSSLGER
jgi:hypothetical protein